MQREYLNKNTVKFSFVWFFFLISIFHFFFLMFWNNVCVMLLAFAIWRYFLLCIIRLSEAVASIPCSKIILHSPIQSPWFWLAHGYHSFPQGLSSPFLGTPLFLKQIKKLPPLSESHPNCCMKIVWNTLKWKNYILYYTKSIENIIIITLYTFRLNYVFITDSLVRCCL